MADNIPVIDVNDMVAGRPGALAATARAVHDALTGVGFLVLTGHDVPAALIEGTFAQARRIHDRPTERKLALALYWKDLTTRGAVLGGITGLVLAVVRTVLGPAVWLKGLGHAQPVFPLAPPTLVALQLAVAVCIVVSLLDRIRRAEIDRTGYVEQDRRMNGGAALAAAE